MLRSLKRSVKQAIEVLDERDRVREEAYAICRSILRESKRAIHSLHSSDPKEDFFKNLESEVLHLKSLIPSDDALFHSGMVQSALQEYAEAVILRALICGDGVPSHQDLGIDPSSYILGMADVIGELRRRVLNQMRDRDLAGAERTMEVMEAIYEEISTCHYPSEVAAVRRKIDIARGVMERTRGDLTFAVVVERTAGRYHE